MDSFYQKQTEPSDYKRRSYDIDNETFEKHSWYLRNALVLASYNNLKQNIAATMKPLMKFFGNLLLGENNDLKNRELQINRSAK
jgi:hypothetical protein